MNTKSTKKSQILTTVLIIIILLGFFGAILYFGGMLYFTGLTPCHPPFWVTVDGVATQKVFAFYDDNKNGIFEADLERALPNITIQLAEETAITDKQGLATVYAYKEGCACKCSKGDTLLVTIPNGWQTTTPIQFILKGNEDTIPLGFYR